MQMEEDQAKTYVFELINDARNFPQTVEAGFAFNSEFVNSY